MADSLRRFHSTNVDPEKGSAFLDSGEARHIRNVLRISEGSLVSVFDGHGSEYECEISRLSSSGAELSIKREITPSSPESPLAITLAVSLLKSDKFDLVIAKAVELGICRFVPVMSSRCDVGRGYAEKRRDRWRKLIIEASKQCGRAKLMELDECRGFSELVDALDGEAVMFSERDGGKLESIDVSGPITLITGPEGGWEDEELDLARSAGLVIVTLGGRVLKAETAALAAAAVVQNRFGDMN